MTVPREDRLVRFHIQLRETESEEYFDGAVFTPEKMLEQARKVLEAYTLDFEVCDWHSTYTVSGDRSDMTYRSLLEENRLVNVWQKASVIQIGELLNSQS